MQYPLCLTENSTQNPEENLTIKSIKSIKFVKFSTQSPADLSTLSTHKSVKYANDYSSQSKIPSNIPDKSVKSVEENNPTQYSTYKSNKYTSKPLTYNISQNCEEYSTFTSKAKENSTQYSTYKPVKYTTSKPQPLEEHINYNTKTFKPLPKISVNDDNTAPSKSVHNENTHKPFKSQDSNFRKSIGSNVSQDYEEAENVLKADNYSISTNISTTKSNKKSIEYNTPKNLNDQELINLEDLMILEEYLSEIHMVNLLKFFKVIIFSF